MKVIHVKDYDIDLSEAKDIIKSANNTDYWNSYAKKNDTSNDAINFLESELELRKIEWKKAKLKGFKNLIFIFESQMYWITKTVNCLMEDISFSFKGKTLYSIDSVKRVIKDIETGKVTYYSRPNDVFKNTHEFDLLNQNIYDTNGNLITEAALKEYNLQFAFHLSEITPIPKTEHFLEHHFKVTSDKEQFIINLEWNILLYSFLKEDQTEKCKFVIEWIRKKQQTITTKTKKVISYNSSEAPIPLPYNKTMSVSAYLPVFNPPQKIRDILKQYPKLTAYVLKIETIITNDTDSAFEYPKLTKATEDLLQEIPEGEILNFIDGLKLHVATYRIEKQTELKYNDGFNLVNRPKQKGSHIDQNYLERKTNRAIDKKLFLLNEFEQWLNDRSKKIFSDKEIKKVVELEENGLPPKKNIFCKSMPLSIPEEHFKVFTEAKSKNGSTFLTVEQYNSFIKKAFCGAELPKIKFNKTTKEHSKIRYVFYEFYNNYCAEYFNTTQCKDIFVKLLTDNFTGWKFNAVKDNFNKRPIKTL